MKRRYSALFLALLSAGCDDMMGMDDDEMELGPVAFGSRRDGDLPEVYVMGPEGANPVRLTDTQGINGQPEWSADGKQIAFMSTRTGNPEIFLMNADGSNPVNLTNRPGQDQAPSWSRTGNRIAFQSNRDGNFEIYVMNADGSSVTRLTSHAGVDQFPTWSPDAQRIAFQRDGQIYVMNADGSGTTRLTNMPGGADMPASMPAHNMPDWSPDGKRIAFMTTRDGYPAIYVMNVDGSNQVNVTPKPAGVPAEQWSSMWPSWSRDSRFIYFQGVRPSTAGDTEIFMTSANGGTVMGGTGTGSNEMRLTHAPGIDSAPAAW